ncbi:DUF6262 family protein [Photobacterium sagamiensis]|uniref:DUF6262 family protein n=1 Tax=Photobacterium sagamiensis TaxID=2910241 RepID=UPI003D0E2829
MEETTKSQIEQVIEAMIKSGEKINVSRVAAKAGVSNALIYNRYPDFKFKINQAKEQQKSKAQQISSTTERESLKAKLTKCKQKQSEAELMALSYQKQNVELWEHIQQVYAMYDQVLAERNDFAERFKFLE